MSVVSSIILATALNDGDGVEDTYASVDKLNAWLLESTGRAYDQLVLVTGRAGGGKCMQCDVWMAGINFLDEEAFMRAVIDIPWEYPDCVQLMLQSEDADLFQVITIPG